MPMVGCTFDASIGLEWERVTCDLRTQPNAHGQANLIITRTKNPTLLKFVALKKDMTNGQGLIKNIVNKRILKGLNFAGKI